MEPSTPLAHALSQIIEEDPKGFLDRATPEKLLDFAHRLIERSQADPTLRAELESLDLEPLFSRLPFKKDLRDVLDILLEHGIGKRDRSYFSNYLIDPELLATHTETAIADLNTKNFIKICTAQSTLFHIALNLNASSQTLARIYEAIANHIEPLFNEYHIDDTQKILIETVKAILNHYQCPESVYEDLIDNPQRIKTFLATCGEFQHILNATYVQKALEKLLDHAKSKAVSVDLEKRIINIASHLTYLTRDTGFPKPLAHRILTYHFRSITTNTLNRIDDRFFREIPKSLIESVIEEKQSFSPAVLHYLGYRTDLKKDTLDHLIKEAVRHHIKQNATKEESGTLNVLVSYFQNPHVRFDTLEWAAKNVQGFQILLLAAPSCRASDLIRQYQTYQDEEMFLKIIVNHPNFPRALLPKEKENLIQKESNHAFNR